MLHYFSLKLNLESSASQPELIQLIKSQGGDAIQTSDGLCLRTPKSEAELKALLQEKGFDRGVTLQPLDASRAEEAAPDVRTFILAGP